MRKKPLPLCFRRHVKFLLFFEKDLISLFEKRVGGLSVVTKVGAKFT